MTSNTSNISNISKLSFEQSFASHPKAKFWSIKNSIKPEDVKLNSSKKYVFDCECGHEIEKTPGNILKTEWCPYCSTPRKKLCSNNECKSCFENSFASHPKAKCWSDKNIKTPRYSFIKTDLQYYFNCDKCNHEFKKNLKDIVMRNGWCMYCANKKLCDDEHCKICLSKSFVISDKAICWSINNKVKPSQVFLNCNKIFLFKCDKCFHEFDNSLCNITAGHWCSYCSNDRLCSNEDCKICFNKSFASIPKAIYWSDKNIKKPRHVFKSVNTKFVFNCNKCTQEFNGTLSHITNGGWCPHCTNKTETKLYELIIKIYPSLIQQYKIDWCKNADTNMYLPFDFVIPEYNIIIELDGLQHFKQVAKWKTPEQAHFRDLYKMKCANDNGYSMIRILQDDVWLDKYKWIEELQTSIEKIKLEKKFQNIFLCRNDEYNIFTKE